MAAPVRRRPCSSPRPTVEASARSRTWRPSSGVLVADGYAGFNGLYEAGRVGGGLTEGGAGRTCAARSSTCTPRRLGSRGGGAGADRGALRGRARPVRQAARCPHPRAADPLEAAGRGAEGLDRDEPGPGAGPSDLAKALRYMLARWPALNAGLRRRASRPRQQRGRAGAALCGGRAQELPVRGIRAGRRACGGVLHPDRDGQDERARSRAYLRDVLTRIADHPARRLADLLPWNWMPTSEAEAGRLTSGSVTERLLRRGPTRPLAAELRGTGDGSRMANTLTRKRSRCPPIRGNPVDLCAG